MTMSKPEFHLQRVNSDGSSEEPELYSLQDLPSDFQLSRRNILGVGVTAASVLGVLSGCGNEKDNRIESQSTIDPKKNVNATNVSKQSDSLVNAHTSKVIELIFTQNGQTLISNPRGKTIKLWSLPSGKLLKTYTKEKASYGNIAATPDGKLLVVTSGLQIKFLSIPDLKLKKTIHENRKKLYVDTIGLTPDGNILVSCTHDGSITLWSVPEMKIKSTLPGTHYSRVHSLAISPDGKMLVINAQSIQLISLPEGEMIRFFHGISHTNNSMRIVSSDLALTPDGKTLFTGTEYPPVNAWLLPEGKKIKTISSGHQYQVTSLAVTPDGNTLVSGSWDKTIKLLSLPDGKLRKTLTGHKSAVRSLAITPDGKTLASGDDDGVIILWDLGSGQLLSYLFDPNASQKDAFTYTKVDPVTGRTITYTLPCGSPVPAGATCVCNCVPGTYRPVTPRPTTGGGTYCTCNKICTCIPICQAHRLLDKDEKVRRMAEQLLLVMGKKEMAYLRWAADCAEPELKDRVEAVIAEILAGKKADQSSWLTAEECLDRIEHSDEIVAIMAAQMLSLQKQLQHKAVRVNLEQQLRIDELLKDAADRPWYIRYGVKLDRQ